VHLTDHVTPLDTSTSRRRVLATGVKLAYAAPLVAASFKLSAQGAFAAVSGGSRAAICTASSGQICTTYEGCGTTALGNPCVCAHTATNQTVCSAYGTCSTPCNTNADCAVVTGYYGDTGPGYCHTGTCCTVPTGYAGACAPLCNP
jgi:hypothetical protein